VVRSGFIKAINFLCLMIALIYFSGGNGCAQTFDIPEAMIFNMEDGMSQTRVTTTFIDSYGFLWVGTSDGLNKYDGYSFVTYRHQPFDTSSISNNYIRCIEEDDKHNLWIGTNDGLNCLLRDKGIFVHLRYNQNDSLSIHSPVIHALYFDGVNDLWIKTEKHLEDLNLNTMNLVSYQHYYSPRIPLLINYSNIIKDVNGLIWFGTKDGLFSFNRENAEFNHYYHDPINPLSLSNNEIRSLREDKNGVLWIGTSDGLNKLDRIHHIFRRFFPQENGNAGEEIAFNDILEDSQGSLWLTSDNGVFLFNKRNSSFIFYGGLLISGNELQLSSMSKMSRDKSDILWLGGVQGLFKIDLKPRKFILYNSTKSSVPKLSSDNISALFKDKDGNIWVALQNNGLDIIDIEKKKKQHLSQKSLFPGLRLPDNNIRSFYEDKNGNIWLGSSNGIFVFEYQRKRIIPLSLYLPGLNDTELKGRLIYDITRDRRGDVWIATDNGVYRYNSKINTLLSYNRIYNEKTSSKINVVYTLEVDEENHIWIGTDNGLIQYDILENIFYLYEKSVLENGLPDRIINSIHIDRENNVWIGTPSGLAFYNKKSESFINYTENDGLPNNFVYSILEDKDGFLWLSTNKGIARFDPKEIIFSNYGLSDGLQNYEFNIGASFSSRDGELFFGGLTGFNSFYPAKIPVNPHIPEIVITKFTLVDRTKHEDKIINPMNPSITVENNKSFTLEYSSLDFTYPAANNYKYSLEEFGDDPVWISVGNERSLTFSNLSRGEYLFKIIGSNNDNIWNNEGDELKINVITPFWNSSIAIFIYVILLIFILYMLFQYRTRNLRNSNRILRERNITAKKVERQKELLSIRNKSIEDSLNYAQRIQKAMLPTSRVFKSLLPESFILHKPKDIVSGDFYWISENNNRIYFAAVDCTGHGVPGAFMSIIGFELFRKIVNMQHIADPGEILQALNANLEEIFGKDTDMPLRDGMDLAFCVLDKKKNILQFAGAFNPMYIVRADKLIEIKGERFSIGANVDFDEKVDSAKVFNSHKIRLQKDDMIYIFSDGYADQFGGPEGKKYKYRRFRHLLLTIHKLPLEKQKQYLDESIEEWRGNFEQIDDILVIGIKAQF
jgi:ligand-binding sensor domain-containing protein/serine phosphatase RsbU (regulator of sigma subunit)